MASRVLVLAFSFWVILSTAISRFNNRRVCHAASRPPSCNGRWPETGVHRLLAVDGTVWIFARSFWFTDHLVPAKCLSPCSRCSKQNRCDGCLGFANPNGARFMHRTRKRGFRSTRVGADRRRSFGKSGGFITFHKPPRRSRKMFLFCSHGARSDRHMGKATHMPGPQFCLSQSASVPI